MIRAFSLLLIGALLALAALTARSGPEEGKSVKENRLAKERSPYLRQHRNNPIDWYPWGEEALERARKEGKPIFLSIGYAACHWCHVMEHESFEDEETAKLLNEVFVCIKVDREERPDLDRVYMHAVQLLNQGRGGWPMTVFLTPDGKPFFARTYLPRAALREITTRVGEIWKTSRESVQNDADAIAEQLATMSEGPEIPATDDTDEQIFENMRNALTARYDRRYGGYGRAPKFPPHTELLFFLEDGARRARPEDRDQALFTLDAMDAGGIHDQVGGGFHRYSTDERWLLPHFEKMLYDNALLAQAYAFAFALTKKPRYRRVVERVFAWLEREMRQKEGGYASSLDADTEGEEGLTYTWTVEELKAVLDEKEYALAASLLGVQERGNFTDEATHRRTGRNILHWPARLEDAARERKEEPEALRTKADVLFEKLRVARDKRAQPGLDDKVITGWNGLLLSAFAAAGSGLGEKAWLERGRELATFLLERSRREDGTLLRFPRGSGPEIPGFCEDYVHLIEGLLDLAGATEETRWSDAARALADRLLDEFHDKEKGGFYTTSRKRHETLFARTMEAWDSPIPSDNGTAARLLTRLLQAGETKRYGQASVKTFKRYRAMMAHPRMAPGVMALLRAYHDYDKSGDAGGAGLVSGDVRVRRDVALVDVFLERAEAGLGNRVEILVRVTLERGWHANAHVPSRKELIATSLATAGKSPVSLADVRYPKAEARVIGPKDSDPVALYEGLFEIRAALVVPKDVPAGPRKVPLVLTLQPCDDASCLAPLEIALEVPLRFSEKDGPRRHGSLFPDKK